MDSSTAFVPLGLPHRPHEHGSRHADAAPDLRAQTCADCRADGNSQSGADGDPTAVPTSVHFS